MPQHKTIKIPKNLSRMMNIDGADINVEKRTVELSFSSEMPVERWFGNEILDHSPGAIDMSRLESSGPLLMDHDPTDQVGVIESVALGTDKVARASVRFSKSARGEEIFQDVMDRIRVNVSVKYRIHEMVLDAVSDINETYRATSWEPYEVSLTSIAADPSVGVGRSINLQHETIEIEVRNMADSVDNVTTSLKKTVVQPNVEQITNDVRSAELKRIKDLDKLGEKYDKFGGRDVARQCIQEGKSVQEFNARVMERLPEQQIQSKTSGETTDIGLSEKEVRQFSFVKAINALANPTDRRAQEAAAYEFECSRTAADKQGKDTRGIFVPSDVLKRDLTVGVATAGGNTVATDLLAGSFIDLLRNSTQVMQRANNLTGLVGNVAIPRQSGGATSYWVAESGAPTESQQAFDQVTLSPNTVGAFVDFSRKLAIQSSIDVEAFIRGDLARVLGLAIDLAAINGSGAGSEPTGILNTSGIGSVVGGTNGLAPTFAHMVDLESSIAAANADVGNLFYINNAVTRGKLKQTEKASSTGQFVFDGDSINGYSALTTNQMPSNLTKGTSVGVCSAIIFGNLADLLIGMWGGIDLSVDPYSNSTSGTVRVVALQDVDIAVRHAESFAAMVDALTA